MARFIRQTERDDLTVVCIGDDIRPPLSGKDGIGDENAMPYDTLSGSLLPSGGGLLLLTVLIGLLIPVYRYVLRPMWKAYHYRQSESYCPSIPLPSLPRNLDTIRIIPSVKKGGLTYKVNLYQLTCNCTSFRRRRRFYPDNDIRRLCRHLRKELQTSNAVAFFDELTQRIIEGRVKDLCYAKVSLLDSDIAFGFHPKNDFARVYTRRRAAEDPPQGPYTGPYDKFTFLISQEIWVYGEDPPGSEEIIDCLKRTVEKFRGQHPENPEPKTR